MRLNVSKAHVARELSTTFLQASVYVLVTESLIGPTTFLYRPNNFYTQKENSKSKRFLSNLELNFYSPACRTTHIPVFSGKSTAMYDGASDDDVREWT